jgi:hypothetical protein
MGTQTASPTFNIKSLHYRLSGGDIRLNFVSTMAARYQTEDGMTRIFLQPEHALQSVPNTRVFQYQDKKEVNPPFLVFCDNAHGHINRKATGVIHWNREWHHIDYIADSREFEIGPVHPNVAEFNMTHLLSERQPEDILGVEVSTSIDEEIRNQPIPQEL